MGLFSKKPKEPEYDAVDCERKKKNLKEVSYLIGILLRFSVTSLDSGEAILA